MTDNMLPMAAEAEPITLANDDRSIDTGADIRAAENENFKPKEQENPEAEKPKELTVEEELEKLRRAKVRDDRRIGKLTAQKYQAMKEAEELRSKYASPQQSPKRAEVLEQGAELSPAKTGIPTNLDQNKFNSYSDYLEARAEEIADYKIERKFAEHSSKQKETWQSEQDRQYVSERLGVIEKQTEEFAKEFPDADALGDEYADVLQDFSPQLKRLFLEADNAPMAFYNLAKEGKLEELANMSIAKAAMEIGRAQTVAVKPKSVTKAPAPIPASRGSASGGKDPSQMTDAEFNDWRRKSIAKKR